ncbi:MAG: hypothetical protein FWC92_07540 [Defluviitaleaceae bacterium]|nr:hypothetical protein [Defluviitaleaceae bacterium]
MIFRTGAGFGILDAVVLVAIILAIIFVVLYFLNKWAGRRMADQQDMVERHKQPATIYVIDKKKDKITNANLPKAMASQVPRMGRMMKMPLVKAKIGPQIMTLVCDKAVYEALPVKKNVTVELAGAYIVSMKGMKTKQQLAEQRKARRQAGDTSVPLKWHEKVLDKFKR